MTIDTSFFNPSDSLISSAKPRFYPVAIPALHHQLRHLISTVEKDWIFYGADLDIYCLHIPTQRTRLLVTLPFSLRCLTSGLGWIAVGGDTMGECALIKLSWKPEPSYPDLDNVPVTIQDSSSASAGTNFASSPDEFPEAILQEIGKEIVNSVTIHMLSSINETSIDEPVVVLCNNDHTVKIYSLHRQEIIADLNHSVSMNYAMISPNSEYLVAVGDTGTLYFYRRQPAMGKSAYYDGQPMDNFQWKLVASPDHPDERDYADSTSPSRNHFFSIAFSPSGHLCAVGAQLGTIIVYDMTVLSTLSSDSDVQAACLCKFKSSKRYDQGGAVRSMAFSPSPWDMLVWAEETGRSGVADVRHAFLRRQVLHLEINADNVERLDVEDVTDPYIKTMDSESRAGFQYGMLPSFLSDPNSAESSLDREVTAHRRRLRRDVRARARSYRSQVQAAADERYNDREIERESERERQVLASLGSRSPYEEAESLLQSGRSVPPYSINYTSSPRVRSSLAEEENHGPGSRADMLRRIMRNLDTPLPGSSTSQVDSLDRSFQPRRRSSVVLSQHNTTSNLTSSLAPITNPSMRLSASPSRIGTRSSTTNDAENTPRISSATHEGQLSRPANIPSEEWDVIRSALEASRRSSPADETHNEIQAQLSRLLSVQRHRQTSPGAGATTARTSTLPTTSSSLNPQSSVQRDLTPDLPPPRVPTPGDLSILENERQSRLSSGRDNDLSSGQPSSLRYHPSTIDYMRQRMQRSSLSRPRSISGLNASSSDTHQSLRFTRMLMQRNADTDFRDANGNWAAGEALERVLRRVGPGSGQLGENVGIGTTGVGWSPDGRQLYIGTTRGIFDFTTNLADRKTFSGLSFR